MIRMLGIGVAIQIAVCAAVGFRLIRLATRTRQIPEAAFGLAFVLLGAVGYPLSIAARGGAGGEVVAGWLLATALFAQDAAAIAIAVGTVETFHRGSKRMRALVGLMVVGFVASLVGHGATVGFVGARDDGAFYWLGYGLRFASFLWTCAVAFRHFARLQKQVRIGLADPVATDRIQLWGATTLCICLGFAVFGIAKALDTDVGASPIVLAVTSAVSLVSSASMTLAFFPPAAYVQRVRALAIRA